MLVDTILNLSLLEILLMFTSFILGLLGSNFLPKYFSKKGENLATKEDISAITERIESVKHEYANQLESIKADLSAKIGNNSFRYQKEYKVLEELTALLVELKYTSLRLRPLVDHINASKSEEEIRRERLGNFNRDLQNLMEVAQKKRPFYPLEIYDAVLEVYQIASSEAEEYKVNIAGKSLPEYWRNASRNQHEIIEKSDMALKTIRDRVVEWESIT